MPEVQQKTLRTVSILTRRLKEGKTYEDFRRAWFHTTGFGVKGKDSGSGKAQLQTFINISDPREIIVLGFTTVTLEQLGDALDIDVKVRGDNPLDEVIEPEIGRSFALQVAEDDFSAAGDIPYAPAMIDGRKTDMAEVQQDLLALAGIYTAAAKKRDALNEARRQAQ
ncbi:MAG TPA: ROK family protein [Methanoregula sp.]|nr:ROK family protein [Methanoregula sp.]